MTIDREDIQEIAKATADILRSAQATVPSPNDTITRAGLRIMLKCDSKSTLSRVLEELKVKPYAHGRFRRADIENAIAQAAARAQAQGGRAA